MPTKKTLQIFSQNLFKAKAGGGALPPRSLERKLVRTQRDIEKGKLKTLLGVKKRFFR